jgi:uncharacterized protein with HEPN domain
MAGLRDVIAHSYYRVDPNIIWDVAVTRIPGIRPVLAQIADAYPFEPLDGTPAERDA